MKRGKKWPLNGLLHLNRDFAAAAAADEGIPDHHLRFEQRHRSYSMDGGGGGDDENGYQEGTGQASKSSISMHGYPVKLQSHGLNLYCARLTPSNA